MILDIFCQNYFSEKKVVFLDPLDPFLDTSDDVETHREASQTILEKIFFDTFQLFGPVIFLPKEIFFL